MVKNIALIGIPNVGKSSILNQICKKAHFNVANWSGLTTRKQTSKVKYQDHDYYFSDLPGIYSLSASTSDEMESLKEVFYKKHDLYIQVIDVTDLETNLYLTLLLKELGIPLMIFVNFSDKLKKGKFAFDINKFERLLKVPIVKTCGLKKDYVGDVLATITSYFEEKNKKKISNFYYYEDEIHNHINYIDELLSKSSNFDNLKKNNIYLYKYYLLHYRNNANYSFIDNKSEIDNTLASHSELIQRHDNNIIIKRQKYISNIISLTSKYYQEDNSRLKWSLKIDKIFLNKWLSIPAFLSIMLLTFILIFNFGTPYKDFLSDVFTIYLPSAMHLNLSTWYGNFIANGIFNSIGTLLSFAPIMYLLFIAIAFIQQSGIMSRVAFVLNKFLSSIGLNGKSIVPFILGFGCNVASVYSTRIIKDPKQRKATALLSPFMSCSARIVVFGLFASTFFGASSALIIFSLYSLGIIIAIILALLAKVITRYKYKDKNENDEIFDLTPYQFPSFLSLIKGANSSVRGYIKKAVTVILFFTLFIWLISYFPNGYGHIDTSYLSDLKYVFQPIFIPLGFGKSWILVVALLPGIIAKETIVATIALLYGINTNISIPNFWINLKDTIVNSFIYILPNHWINGELFSISQNGSLSSKILSDIKSFSSIPQLTAYSYLVFILLTIPCVTTLGALYQEFGWKLTFQSSILGLITPYLTALILFQLLMLILRK